MGKVEPLEVRFWKYVDRTQGCWAWKGALDTHGYGGIREDRPSRKTAKAHRVSWALHFGDIPESMLVLHHCDNRKCVNPGHLFLGRDVDNFLDAGRKGRMTRSGRRIPEATADAIKADISHGCGTLGEIAHRYGVGRKTVQRIAWGKHWSTTPVANLCGMG